MNTKSLERAMADGESKTMVRYGSDIAAARESYEAEIAQLRADLLKSRMETSREQGRLGIVESALQNTRRELLEAREEICALHGDDEENGPALSPSEVFSVGR